MHLVIGVKNTLIPIVKTNDIKENPINIAKIENRSLLTTIS